MTSDREQLLRIRVRFESGGDDRSRFAYRVARTAVLSDSDISELRPFAAGSRPVPYQESGVAPISKTLPLVYRGSGWIGGRKLNVEAYAAGSEHLLVIEDGTRLSVCSAKGECVIRVLRSDSESGKQMARLAVLGPGLALALALLGRFSLHASCVRIDGRTTVFLGESGSGKSTVAALAGCHEADRLADDVLPVTVSPGGAVTLLPRFPQLKLAGSDQWLAAEELPCDRLVSLRRSSGSNEASFTKLTARDAVLRLCESSVASRLFSTELRRREFETWARAAGANSLVEWQVPDGVENLDEIYSRRAFSDAEWGRT